MVARSNGLREGDLLTVAEALRILPIGKSKLYALLDEGEIEHIRVPSTGGRRARLFIPRAPPWKSSSNATVWAREGAVWRLWA